MIRKGVVIAAALVAQAAPVLAVRDAKVERIDRATVAVSWSDPKPVSVYVADQPTTGVAGAWLAIRDVRAGRATLRADTVARHYFLLRTPDGQVTRVAERQLPLVQGSNFRDLGGYEAAGGKHVRWGMIYRSAATPMLSDTDVAQVNALGLRDMIDLRSSEERSLAPSKVTGVRYSAVGYSMMAMTGTGKSLTNGVDLYRSFPAFFAPQLRILFDDLIRKQTPLVYHCSAGQDRTGFATAMVLTALGVPRAKIMADYHLSTIDRRPQYELPRIDDATARSNPVAAMFAAYQKSGASATPQPLKDKSGKAFLEGAFEEINSRWGSTDAYLKAEIGVSKRDIAQLRRVYLE